MATMVRWIGVGLAWAYAVANLIFGIVFLVGSQVAIGHGYQPWAWEMAVVASYGFGLIGSGIALAIWLTGFKPPVPFLIANATFCFAVRLAGECEQWWAYPLNDPPSVRYSILVFWIPLLNSVVQAAASGWQRSYTLWVLPVCVLGLFGCFLLLR